MSPDLGFSLWGGQDLNLRPTDYEFDSEVSATCGADRETPSDQLLPVPGARMTSRRFPVRRGADAGHIVAHSNENRVVAISQSAE
jgi:hypothetical protein